jgi:hypothetical protein
MDNLLVLRKAIQGPQTGYGQKKRRFILPFSV